MSYFKVEKINFVDAFSNFYSSQIISSKTTQIIFDKVFEYFFERYFHIDMLMETDGRKKPIHSIIETCEQWLLKEYPLLKEKFTNFLFNQIIWLQEIINTISAQYPSSQIASLELFKGDLHNNNRSTTRVEFVNGNVVYVKPRNLETEVKFYSITKLIFPNLQFGDLSMISLNNIGIMSNVNSNYGFRFKRCSYYFQLGLSSESPDLGFLLMVTIHEVDSSHKCNFLSCF